MHHGLDDLIKAFRSIGIGNNAGTHDGRQWVEDHAVAGVHGEGAKRARGPFLTHRDFHHGFAVGVESNLSSDERLFRLLQQIHVAEC